MLYVISLSFYSQPTISEERKANQEAVDSELLKCVEKVPMLKEYLHERFTLKRGDRPHDMKF